MCVCVSVFLCVCVFVHVDKHTIDVAYRLFTLELLCCECFPYMPRLKLTAFASMSTTIRIRRIPNVTLFIINKVKHQTNMYLQASAQNSEQGE